MTDLAPDRSPGGPGPSEVGPLARLSTGERRLLDAIGDPVALSLLVALSGDAREVHRLVVETGLPQSSIYRKLRELSDGGLIRTDRLAFTREGRKVELFRTPLREVRLRLEEGRLQVEVAFRSDSSDRLHALWANVQRFGR